MNVWVAEIPTKDPKEASFTLGVFATREAAQARAQAYAQVGAQVRALKTEKRDEQNGATDDG